MSNKDLRTWINRLEAEGELRRVKAKVDWDGELGAIVGKVIAQDGPAILFENIKDYENTWCRRLFADGHYSRRRLALMMGMPKDTPQYELVQLLRRRFKEPTVPMPVDTGSVKENFIKGDDVDLFQIPVPKWHPLDGGRYINTWGAVVTMDPDTGEHNVGMYRGMLISRNKIGVMLVPAQGWGAHYARYQEMRRPMPVAVVYGWDPSLGFMAASPLTSVGEYEVMGAIRQEPVPLIKCETSDLRVPASAEMVVEGTISHDPNTYEMEGPFGEWIGYYGAARRRPVLTVSSISFRNAPIFCGTMEGQRPRRVDESSAIGHAGYSVGNTAIMWNILESQGIPGILDIAPWPWMIVKIHKTYQGQARHIAAALWGSRLTVNTGKIIIVVEEDVDIHNARALQVAIQTYVDPAKDVVVFPMNVGASLDISIALEDRDEMVYGAGLQNKLLIDATIDWITLPIREEWGNRRIPPTCTGPLPEIEKLVDSRWQEYGF